MRSWATSQSQPRPARRRRRPLGRGAQPANHLLLLLGLVSRHLGVGAVGDADTERDGLRLTAGSEHPHPSLKPGAAASRAGTPAAAGPALGGTVRLYAGRPEA